MPTPEQRDTSVSIPRQSSSSSSETPKGPVSSKPTAGQVPSSTQPAGTVKPKPDQGGEASTPTTAPAADPTSAEDAERQALKDKILANIFPFLDWDGKKPPKLYDFKAFGLFCSEEVLHGRAELARFLNSTGHTKPATRLLKDGKTESGQVWEIDSQQKVAELMKSMSSKGSLGLDSVAVDKQQQRVVRTVQIS